MEDTLKKLVSHHQQHLILALILVMAAALTAAGSLFYRYTSEQLYEESVSQLEELSQQLFEKLEVQINAQWGYLDNLKFSLEQAGPTTQEELVALLKHGETDLGPVGKQLYFRIIDEEGHYYTDTGRHGFWTGLDQLSGVERQSFLIANWLDDENYMAFAVKAPEALTVDGKAIEYLVLLRSMTDMQPFFHSSAFENQNVAYITDYDGFVLAADGGLPGIDFEGKNVYRSMEGQTFPHMGSFAAVLEQGDPSGTVCTDVIIDETKYYLVYDRLPDYDWAVLLLMSADDVAVSATGMVNSLLRVFLLFIVVLMAALIAIFLFILRVRKNQQLIALKEKNEAQLQNANRKLQQAQAETEQALLAAQAATKAKSQFLSNISHDIRTPMNAIMGITELMDHEAEYSEKQQYYIKKLKTSGKHMLSLINDILDMSKIESGEVSLNVEPLKLAEQVGQVESIIRSQSNEKDQEFTVCVHEVTHEYLIGDCIRIRQIFLNLLMNAVKYTQPGGSIRFELTELPCEEPGCATIRTSVIDNGYGMSAEFLKRIFEPFTREVNSLTNKIQGTGLGMSIAKNLVDLMGGTITVESEPNKGSRFDVTLTLPIDRNAMRTPDIHSVLLLSDEELLVANVKAALRETSVALRVAATPEEAVELLRSEPVDAIVLSASLSAEAQADTVRLLRKTVQDAVLILCCDYAHRDDVRKALVDSGVDELIARPFFFENLVLAVEHSHEEGTKAEQEVHHSPLSGRRFLCAEDNALNAEILEAMLEIHGASCTICPDGAELVKAFASVKPGEYDAILMDVQMPNMNGMEATRVLRSGENPLGRTIPIIAMTANAFSSDVEECLEAGMDAHLAKPLDITALERSMQELLGDTYLRYEDAGKEQSDGDDGAQ